MRQGDGSDLLGQNDPRNADIGILYVGPEDSRQEILTAITTQELQGRKQIAIVLPEQGKAFRQPVEFDGLKNMRRGLKAQLIFIAPAGPGPAEFARHRRFVVYSSLETFRTALITEGAPYNPRGKAVPGGEKRPSLLVRGRASKGREQNLPPALPPVVPIPIPPVAPTPPTPRIVSSASAQPVMPPTPPTPRVPPQGFGPDGQSVPSPIAPTPRIEDMDTHTLELENPAPDRGIGTAAAMGALTASALDDDDALAPPVTPRQPQGGGVIPSAQGSATPGGASARPPDGRRGPSPLLLGQQTNTPRPGGSGKLPAASAQGSQTRTGTGKQPAVRGRGTKQLTPAQDVVDAPVAPKPPNGKNGGSGKLPAALAVGAVPVMAAAASHADAPAAPNIGNPPLPAAMAVTGTPGGPGMGQRQVGLTPLPPPVSQRRRRARGRKRLLLFLLLGLLTLLVISGIVVSALGGPGGLATLGHLTATVTITPQSKVVQNDYLIAGVTTPPDAGQRQITARVLKATSDTKSVTNTASGSVPATAASGVLRFINTNAAATTLASTVIAGNDGIDVTFNGPITVPSNPPFIDVNAYAVNPGAAGNIKTLDINKSCCFSGITVRNSSSFHGGQDAQPNSIIQQSDIDGGAKQLVTPLMKSTQAALQKQVQSNERVVEGSFQCTPTTTANHRADDHAPSVTVSVSVACTEEVFDFAGAQKMASSLLATNLPGGIDLTGYKLVEPIITSLVSATVVSGANQVNVNMQAAAKWVYQFDNQQQQNIKQTLAKKSKADALGILRQYAGLASANISISSGSIMPAIASDITVNIVGVPGLAPGATPTPYVPVGGTPTSAGTPGGGGTPNEGS